MQTFENVLFTNLSVQNVSTKPMSSILPMLNVVASEWGLQLSRSKDFMTAKRILLNSVKSN